MSKLTANDYYFMIDSEHRSIFFVEKSHWDKHKSIDDTYDRHLEALFPVTEEIAWSNDMESAYSPYYKGTMKHVEKKVAVDMLTRAGFTRIKNPWN